MEALKNLLMPLLSHHKRNRIIHELKLTLITLLIFGVISLSLLVIYSHPFVIYGILLFTPIVILIVCSNRIIEALFFSDKKHSSKELAIKSSTKRPRYWKDIKGYQPIREDDTSILSPPENP